MAEWYSENTVDDLTSHHIHAKLAPGASEGINLLKSSGIRTAIVSVTWEFAVEWFATRLGIEYYAGTRLFPYGCISHFWAQDKPIWLRTITEPLGFGLDAVAAVGDSSGDIPMLEAVGYPFFVGHTKPGELMRAEHLPGSSIYTVAQHIVEAQIS